MLWRICPGAPAGIEWRNSPGGIALRGAGSQEKLLLNFLDQIYNAAIDPTAWLRFLERYVTTAHAGVGVIQRHDLKRQISTVEKSVNFNPGFQQSYNDYYGKINPWRIRGGHLLRPGKIITGPMMCPMEEFLRSEFYNDYLRPQDLHHSYGVCLLRENGVATNLTIVRSKAIGDFTPREIRLLQALYPHVRRALQFEQRAQIFQARETVMEQVFDFLPIGVMLVDGRGRIVMMNRCAEEILEKKDGLALKKEGLCAADPGQTTQLQKLIHQCILTSIGQGFDSGGAVMISRPSMRPPIEVLVTPIRSGKLVSEMRNATAALFFRDMEQVSVPQQSHLEQSYGLTRAESKLAVTLAAGKALDEAADQIGIRPGTARNQLKSVFAKTHTHRQAELMQLLLSNPLQMSPQ